MKRLLIITYALWVIGAIVLKIYDLVGWWVATSWLWLPLAIVLTFVLGVFLVVALGDWLKRREEAKIPASCENCLFGITSEYADEGRCLGEVLGEGNVKQGTLCQHYKKHIIR